VNPSSAQDPSFVLAGRTLHPFDCREPRWRTIVVKSRLNAIPFDGDNLPSIARAECRSQLFLTDGVRACVGTLVAEAQDIQGSIGFGHRRQARGVSRSLVDIEGVEETAVQHGLKRAAQTLQMERVSGNELDVDAAVFAFLTRDRQCRFGYVKAQNWQAERGDVKSVLAGPAARIEHGSDESALRCQTHDYGLRLTNIPGRRATVVRRIPRQSGHSFVAGWVPTTERIVSAGFGFLRQLRFLLQLSLRMVWRAKATGIHMSILLPPNQAKASPARVTL
jgi:hypothetical protein